MGRPLQPKFETGQMTPRTMFISWETKSLSPIIDYTFRFRSVPTGNEDFRKKDRFSWTPLTIPADKSSGPFHTKSYKLEGLLPATVYEMTVKARNPFGWSEDSKIQQFSTPSKSESKTINEKFNFQFFFLFFLSCSLPAFFLFLLLPTEVDIINNASTVTNENDMNYDEFGLGNNEIYNSAYNVATQLDFTHKTQLVPCLLVVFVTFFPTAFVNILSTV